MQSRSSQIRSERESIIFVWTPGVEVYGIAPNQNIRHGLRIYLISVLLDVLCFTQWALITYFIDWRSFKRLPMRYGYWLIGTFFGIFILAFTPIGRKFPWNVALMIIIVETSTWYISIKQANTAGFLINMYGVFIVICVVIASIFFGAYFPMRLVPGDMILSLVTALCNIMFVLYFINSNLFKSLTLHIAICNYFAIVAITMIIYTATIIHERQFDVPQNEYLFLSVILFFSQMILHDRVLSWSFTSKLKCTHVVKQWNE